MVLHAVTSRPMMTKYDPWVNMLRTCVAAFAAGVGGADAVTVLPFDARLGLPGRVRAPDRAQHLDPAGRGVPRRQGRRPRRWRVRRREAHRRPRRRRLGGARPDRGRRRRRRRRSRTARCARGSTRSSPSATGRSPRASRPLTGLTEFPNLHETLPERTPYAEGALARPPLRRAVRGAARRARRDARSSSRRWARSPRTPRGPPSPPTCSPPAASTWSTRVVTTTSRPCWAPLRRPAGRLPGRPRQGVRRVGRRPRRRRSARPVPSGSILAGKPRRGHRDRRHLRDGSRRARLPARGRGRSWRR